MGEQRKIFKCLRAGILSFLMILACFMLTAGFAVVGTGQNVFSAFKLNPSDSQNSESEITRSWDDLRADFFTETRGKICYIHTPGELAYMNYVLTESGKSDSPTWDYSGYTFVLGSDINLNNIYVNNIGQTVYPLWTPINPGKNKDITFDGAGHKIIGMNVKYEDTNVARNVGFFANMIGGIVKNVTFVNPKIVYSYQGTSIAETDPNRPKLPTDICVGVVAGKADSTYIKEVDIVNPVITLESENVNAHNFHMGTAVGELKFTAVFDENHQRASINTVAPKQFGLDSVNVYVDGSLKPSDDWESRILMRIWKGTDDTTTYGKALYGYFGGLVGTNVSSRVINSTVRNVILEPRISYDVAGTFYIGGLVGLTTQITTSRELVVAAGIYNNLIKDLPFLVESFSANTIGTFYCGNLVGRVYTGGWVYNNLIYSTMPFDKMFGEVCNSSMYIGDHDDCVSNIVGALDRYYFDEHQLYIGGTGCIYADLAGVVICSRHQVDILHLNSENNYGSETVMSEHNFYFPLNNLDDFYQFTNDAIYTDENNVQYTQFDLLTNVCENIGELYFASLPILYYETEFTVDVELSALDQLYNVSYQFRRWEMVSNEPCLGNYYGVPCLVKFIANGPTVEGETTISTGTFEMINEVGYVGKEPISEIELIYQQIIHAPTELPVCDGYRFVGWKVKGWEGKNADLFYCPYKNYLDSDGFYKFDLHERIQENEREFVAIWEIQTFTVSYMIRQYSSNGESYQDIPYSVKPTEQVTFGNTLKGFDDAHQPTSDQGLAFVGWFLEENLPLNGGDADANLKWKFGQFDGTRMPGHDITLYAGWINNFTLLSQLLDDSKYKMYYDNSDAYFDKTTGKAFKNAYSAAFQARASGNTSNAKSLLENLQNTYQGLRVDPVRLLETPAFNETLVENTCPFLYDYNVYLSYFTFKKDIVEKYVEIEATDEIKNNIDAYVTFYERLNQLFHSLNDNIRSSVAAAGGVDAKEVKDLIKKHQDLETRYEKLFQTNEYKRYDLTTLLAARDKANEKWMKNGDDVVLDKNVVLKDVESVVADYEKAFNNLKPNNISDEEWNESKNSKKGVNPIVIGVLIVLVLAAGVFGYIGVDFVKNKKHFNVNFNFKSWFKNVVASVSKSTKKQGTTTNGANDAVNNVTNDTSKDAATDTTDDDDTYI